MNFINIRIHKLFTFYFCHLPSFNLSALCPLSSVSRQRSSAGFTLVELLVALSLLSIITGMVFSFFLFTNKQIIKREKKSFAFESSISLMHSMENNIRKSRATVYLDENKWQFLRQNGDTCIYVFDNGKLTFNGIPVSIEEKPIISFSFTCFGKDSLLDLNNDHEIDFDELDLSSDRKIDEDETQNISRIRATINFTNDPLDAVYIEESVKNRL